MTEYLILVCSVNNLCHLDNVKLYNIRLYLMDVVISGERTHDFSGDRHWQLYSYILIQLSELSILHRGTDIWQYIVSFFENQWKSPIYITSRQFCQSQIYWYLLLMSETAVVQEKYWDILHIHSLDRIPGSKV